MNLELRTSHEKLIKMLKDENGPFLTNVMVDYLDNLKAILPLNKENTLTKLLDMVDTKTLQDLYKFVNRI